LARRRSRGEFLAPFDSVVLHLDRPRLSESDYEALITFAKLWQPAFAP